MYFEIPKRFLKTFYSGLTQRICVKALEVVNSVSCVTVAAQTRSLRRQINFHSGARGTLKFLKVCESEREKTKELKGFENRHGILKVLEFRCFVKEQNLNYFDIILLNISK